MARSARAAGRPRKTARPVRARTMGVPLPGATLGQLCDEIPGARLLAGARATRVREVRRDPARVERGDLLVLDDRALATRARERAVRAALARGAGAIARTGAHADDARDAPVAVLQVPDPIAAAGIASSAVWGHPSFSIDLLLVVGDGAPAAKTLFLLREHLRAAFGGEKVGMLGPYDISMPGRTPRARPRDRAASLARELAKLRDAHAEYVVAMAGWDELVSGAFVGSQLRALIVPPPAGRGAIPAARRDQRLEALCALGAPTCVLDLDSTIGNALHARLASRHGGLYTVSTHGRHPDADTVAGKREWVRLPLRVGDRTLSVVYFGAGAEVMTVATLAAIGGAELASQLPKVLTPRTPPALKRAPRTSRSPRRTTKTRRP